jgi:putative chitinase
MFITSARIALLAPHVVPPVADALAAALETAMPEFGITHLLDRAHFMAQCCWESDYFARFEEDLHYTHADRIAAMWPRLAARAEDLVGKPEALANAAYAWHNGNGSEASGDGWLFRGRGLFDLTGRASYAHAEAALGHPYLTDPDRIARPQDAVLTALNFWKENRCGVHALLDDCEAVTRIINGRACEGLTQRRDLTEQAKRIFT